jgi:DNA helicase II / ATP-dependent DNA helicase PcrA
VNGPDPQRAIWAVVSRHNLYRPRGAWPKSLVDYHPSYRAETASKAADTLCRMMQKAYLLHANRKPTVDVLELLTAGTVQYLTRYGFVGPTGRSVTSLNLGAWTDYCHELRTRLGLPDPPEEKAESLAAYLTFNDSEALSPLAANPERSTKQIMIDGLTIRLGSIHSVKGRTVDAILVLESEVYRGPAANQQVMDLETVLPHAFGIASSDFSTSEARLAAATNVFVGITRARELLALALRREAASDGLLEAARQQGWHVRDLR